MRRDELEHLIRAAGGVLNESALIVVGSQSILGSYSTALPPEAVFSCEADFVLFEDATGKKADLVDGTLGEQSPFHEMYGVYAHGVSMSTSRLPRGWKDRLVPMRTENTSGVTAYCLEVHDLLISKYLANREKDHTFCRAVARSGLVEANALRDRLAETDCTEDERRRLSAAIQRDTLD